MSDAYKGAATTRRSLAKSCLDFARPVLRRRVFSFIFKLSGVMSNGSTPRERIVVLNYSYATISIREF